MKKIFVFAPHQDDEAFSCAGSIAKQIQEGYEVYIHFMTDGRLGHTPFTENMTDAELAKVRMKEALEAAKVMGVQKDHVIFYGYHDQSLGKMKFHDEIVSRLVDSISKQKPDLIYLAITNYQHQDHLAMYFLVFEALDQAKYRADIRVSIPKGFMSMVRPAPNNAEIQQKFKHIKETFPVENKIEIDISDTISQKRDAIKAHETQMGMFSNLIDPDDDFEDILGEIFEDVYKDRKESFEVRKLVL